MTRRISDTFVPGQRRRAHFRRNPRCPVKGCTQARSRGSLAVCTSCWELVPPHLRDDLVAKHDVFRAAGWPDKRKARQDLEEVRILVVVAAEGGLARHLEEERKRARRRDLMRSSSRKPAAA